MKTEYIEFCFTDNDNIATKVLWRFDLSYAPDYKIEIIVDSIKSRVFKTSKQPTINNARKFAEE